MDTRERGSTIRARILHCVGNETRRRGGCPIGNDPAQAPKSGEPAPACHAKRTQFAPAGKHETRISKCETKPILRPGRSGLRIWDWGFGAAKVRNAGGRNVKRSRFPSFWAKNGGRGGKQSQSRACRGSSKHESGNAKRTQFPGLRPKNEGRASRLGRSRPNCPSPQVRSPLLRQTNPIRPRGQARNTNIEMPNKANFPLFGPKTRGEAEEQSQTKPNRRKARCTISAKRTQYPNDRNAPVRAEKCGCGMAAGGRRGAGSEWRTGAGGRVSGIRRWCRLRRC